MVLSTIFPHLQPSNDTHTNKKVIIDEQLVLLKNEAVFEFLPIQSSAKELFIEVIILASIVRIFISSSGSGDANKNRIKTLFPSNYWGKKHFFFVFLRKKSLMHLETSFLSHSNFCCSFLYIFHPSLFSCIYCD